MLDRVTGQFLLGKPFVKVNWWTASTRRAGRMRVPGKVPTPEGELIMPTVLGGTNWYPPSYSPRTGLFYFGVGEHRHNAVEGRWTRRAFGGPRHADGARPR